MTYTDDDLRVMISAGGLLALAVLAVTWLLTGSGSSVATIGVGLGVGLLVSGIKSMKRVLGNIKENP